MSVKQMDIGYVKELTYHYQLDLKDERTIQYKLRCFHPDEEEWLSNHLDKLLANGGNDSHNSTQRSQMRCSPAASPCTVTSPAL